MQIFGKNLSKMEVLKKVGRIEQIGGTRPILLTDGPGAMLRGIEVQTGSGLSFTVLPDRGLDLSRAYWNGASLAWESMSGETHPAYYEADGLNFLRSMAGGLLVTCGLTHMGSPCEDEGEKLGLHGRYSSIPASNVASHGEWVGDEYVLTISGDVREAHLFGPNLRLHRTITTRLGSSTITLHDTVTNEGFKSSPFMILYHCNWGFPLLDEKTVLYSPARRVVGREDRKPATPQRYGEFLPPTNGIAEDVFYHEQQAGKDGYVSVVLANHEFAGGQGLGLLERYKMENLPWFVQWKMCGEGNYIMGLEPGNCHVEGRDKARREGQLPMLEPGEVREFDLEWTVLGDNPAIERALKSYGLKKKVPAAGGQKKKA